MPEGFMPEDAWLLLSEKFLYLMSSEYENRYYERLNVGKTHKDQVSVESIPHSWFIKPRSLVVNYEANDADIKPVDA